MPVKRKSLTSQEKMTMPRPKVQRTHYQCQFSDCNYDWQTRRDTPPARCPGCQRVNWMQGDREKRALLQQLQRSGAAPMPSSVETTVAIEAK